MKNTRLNKCTKNKDEGRQYFRDLKEVPSAKNKKHLGAKTLKWPQPELKSSMIHLEKVSEKRTYLFQVYTGTMLFLFSLTFSRL